jgi:RNA polymerase sigma-70 factor (ECF subfamily)
MVIPDKVLIILLKQGNIKAFEQVYNNYHKQIFCFADRSLRNADEAKEIVQHTFIKLWENRETLDEDLSMGAFLFTIARNLIVNYYRKLVHAQYYAKIIISNGDIDNSTIQQINADELRKQINELIAQLPGKRRAIFLLSRDEGLSYKEIAEKLNISVNTVETQISRALEYLRGKLNDLYK